MRPCFILLMITLPQQDYYCQSSFFTVWWLQIRGNICNLWWLPMSCTVVEMDCFSMFHAEHNYFGLSPDRLDKTERGGRWEKVPKEEGGVGVGWGAEKHPPPSHERKGKIKEDEKCGWVLKYSRRRVNRWEAECCVTREERCLGEGGRVT